MLPVLILDLGESKTNISHAKVKANVVAHEWKHVSLMILSLHVCSLANARSRPACIPLKTFSHLQPVK